MASVIDHVGTRSTEPTSARAQLLALTAVVVAATILTLVLLVNASAYTIAETTAETTPDDAVRHRSAAISGTDQILRAANRAEHGTSRAARERVVDGVEALGVDLARNAADRGAVGHLETNLSRTTPGWIVSADGRDGSLVNESGATGYTIAGDVDRSRRVTLVFDPSRLESTTRQHAGEEAFHVVFETPTPTVVYVYRTTGDVIVAMGIDEQTPRVVCTAPAATDAAELRLELSGERLETSRCPGLWPSTSLARAHTYRISVENADAIDGTLTATVQTATPASPPHTEHDGIKPGVYDTTVILGYATESHRFETMVRVAPGEPRV